VSFRAILLGGAPGFVDEQHSAAAHLVVVHSGHVAVTPAYRGKTAGTDCRLSGGAGPWSTGLSAPPPTSSALANVGNFARVRVELDQASEPPCDRLKLG
jgi:hypothetical protein